MNSSVFIFLREHRRWVIPLALMILIAPFTPAIDMAAARAFYDTDTRTFSQHPFFQFMFLYGVIPALITLAAAAAMLALATFSKRWRHWQQPALVIILTITIGSGIIVNTLLKEHGGRPRPRQVVEFGGQSAFRPFYVPTFSRGKQEHRSLSSGHATMGFAFFSLALLGQRYNSRRWALFGWTAALVLGAALSVTRVAQGGHFVSDILLSTLIMWLSALTADWAVHR